MNFKKPPITEMWIGFHCRSTNEESGTVWAEKNATEFIKGLGNDFAAPELLKSRQFIVDDRSFNEASPTVKTSEPTPTLERVRAYRQDRSRCLQLFRSRMVYNWIRAGEEYPTFANINAEAAEVLKKYFETFHPEAVVSAVIHYVDFVVLPESNGGTFDLGAYFHLCPKIPEGAFETLRGFAMSLDFPGLSLSDRQTVQFRNEPPVDNQVAFRMEWEYVCDDIIEVPGPQLAARLEKADTYAVKSWIACLQQKTLDLFEPEES